MIKNEGEGARREGKHEQRLGVTQPGFVTWFTAFKEGGLENQRQEPQAMKDPARSHPDPRPGTLGFCPER